MNRRDFLRPKNLLSDTLEDLLARTPEGGEVALLQLSRRAMATDFEILIPYGAAEAMTAGEDAFDLIDSLETLLTVYRDNSEMSRVNQLAADVAVRVDPRLFDLFTEARRIWEETDEAFDITAGALIKAWGFFKGPRRVPSEEERREVLSKVGMRHVEMDEKTKSVRYRKRGLEINLGSIGKGYALDRAGELLRRKWSLGTALLQGGHSSILALGSQPGDPRGWGVGLRNPRRPEERMGIIFLRSQALATSAATFKHLEHEGRKLGHILDPRSGWPAEGMGSVTVLAPTAAEADALATGLFILGMEKAVGFCEEHAEIGAILIPEEESAKPVTMNIPARQLEWTR